MGRDGGKQEDHAKAVKILDKIDGICCYILPANRFEPRQGQGDDGRGNLAAAEEAYDLDFMTP